MTFGSPFYGATAFGREYAEFLNRLTLIVYLAIPLYAAWLQYLYFFIPNWMFLFLVFCVYLPFVVGIFDRVFRILNNILMVLIYGTTDRRELRELTRNKDASRQAKEAEEEARRNAKKLLRKANRDAKRDARRFAKQAAVINKNVIVLNKPSTTEQIEMNWLGNMVNKLKEKHKANKKVEPKNPSKKKGIVFL